MKNVILTMLLGLISSTCLAQAFDVPVQPPEMRPGYALEGKGLHSAVPTGQPGPECVINPVSMKVGFTEVTTTKLVAGQIVEIPVNVLFDFNGDVVRPTGIDALNVFYAALVENGVESITVVGHTDSKGTEVYNLDLGLRRAVAVSLALVVAGFDAGSLEVATAGESEPKVSNTLSDGSDDPAGRQQNRRVDIEIVSVREQEVEIVSIVEVRKNPQIFHVLGSNNTVKCGGQQPAIGVAVGGRRLRTNGGIVIAVPR